LLEESASHLEKGQIDKGWESINKASKQDVKPRDYHIAQWIEEFGNRQLERKYNKEHPGHIVRIPTGFKQLDRILSGGIETGELGLVVATTGKGKSIMLINLAFWAAATGHPTVYFTLEMPIKQICQRLDSRWTKYEYTKFKTYDFMPSELRLIDKKVSKATSQFGGKLVVVEMPVRRTSVIDLNRVLDDLQDDYGFTPQMIVVDSGDHMRSVGRFESHRLEQAEVYWGLSGMAQQMPCCVWSSVQAGKEYKDTVAEAEAVSESYDKGRIASIILSLNTPEKKSRSTKVTTDEDEDEDEKKGKKGKGKDDEESRPSVYTEGKYIEMRLAKYRDGEDKVTIPMDAQFTRMYIQEAETYTEEV
jgi:replicative DNA helicase